MQNRAKNNDEPFSWKIIKDLDTLNKVSYCEIHPAIGIARLGNSEEFFIGPQVPNTPFLGSFRDDKNLLRRQAARFRVFGFSSDKSLVGEFLHDESFTTLTWSVKLANKKAAWYQFKGRFNLDALNKNLPIDMKDLRNSQVVTDRSTLENIPSPEPKSISGVDISGSEYKFEGGKIFGVPAPYLGELRTDGTGNLLVLPGKGVSATVKTGNPIMNYANNDYWYDDTSDGPVDCEVLCKTVNGKPLKLKVVGSWVIAAPPKYAPATKPLVTLYQLLAENATAIDKDWVDPLVPKDSKVEYYRDIYPIFKAISDFSWLNKWANAGHGINSFGNFVSDDWQTILKDNDQKNEDIRKAIFNRLRAPTLWKITEPQPDLADLQENKELYGEANNYYMPLLSGDNGDMELTDAAPDTWLSLTPQMYANMEQWSVGKFQTKWTPPSVYDHPQAITLAALEWCIGGPFYPGIEITFIVLHAKESFSAPFRFNKAWGAGDITKWMALPWQADFYECQSHWWPAQRPDNVLTKSLLEHILQTTPKDKLKRKIGKSRVAWARGLRINPNSHDFPHWGDEDMVRYWHNLGFVIPHEISDSKLQTKLNVLIEDQYNLTFGRLEISTVDQLKDALQQAMAIELCTIPVYLFAYFSINDPVNMDDDDEAKLTDDMKKVHKVREIIKSVAIQEMLHLCLAANVLSAIGGTPTLYDSDFIPEYPTPLPHHSGNLILKLQPVSLSTLGTFMKVEYPEWEPPQPDESEHPTNNVKETSTKLKAYSSGTWHTIGEFYDAIEKALENLADSGQITFSSENNQFPPLGYSPSIPVDKGIITVKNKGDALDALALIKIQGEGSKTDHHDDESYKELAHYYRFKKAREHLEKIKDLHAFVSNASGDATKAWFIKETPNKGNGLYVLLTAFNAAYCYMLLIIEQIYTKTDRKPLLVRGLFLFMKTCLSELSKLIMSQPLPNNTSVYAGPIFSWYDFNKPPTWLNMQGQKPSYKTQLMALFTLVDKTFKSDVNFNAFAVNVVDVQSTKN